MQKIKSLNIAGALLLCLVLPAVSTFVRALPPPPPSSCYGPWQDFTPNHTSIPCGIWNQGCTDLNTSQRQQLADNVVATYPHTQILNDATYTYNCHNAAWST